MADLDLKVLLSLQDKATEDLKRFNAEVERTKKKLASLNKQSSTSPKSPRTKSSGKISPTSKTAAQTSKNADKVVAANKKVGKSLDDVTKKSKKSDSALMKWGKRLGALAVVGFATKVAKVGVEFEKMKASLATVTGGVQEGKDAFENIQQMAEKLPQTVQEVTTAFVRMKSLGIEPTQSRMAEFGDIAAGMGISITQVAEAAIDAQVGEFERIKELGIKVKKVGGEYIATFKGVETNIGSDSAKIVGYLSNIAKSDFGGAAAKQMETTAGKLSNLGDSFNRLADAIANSGLLDLIKRIANGLTLLIETISKSLPDIKAWGIEAFGNWKELFVSIRQKIDEFTSAFKLAFVTAFEAVTNKAIKFRNTMAKAFNTIANFTGAKKISMLPLLKQSDELLKKHKALVESNKKELELIEKQTQASIKAVKVTEDRTVAAARSEAAQQKVEKERLARQVAAQKKLTEESLKAQDNFHKKNAAKAAAAAQKAQQQLEKAQQRVITSQQKVDQARAKSAIAQKKVDLAREKAAEASAKKATAAQIKVEEAIQKAAAAQQKVDTALAKAKEAQQKVEEARLKAAAAGNNSEEQEKLAAAAEKKAIAVEKEAKSAIPIAEAAEKKASAIEKETESAAKKVEITKQQVEVDNQKVESVKQLTEATNQSTEAAKKQKTSTDELNQSDKNRINSINSVSEALKSNNVVFATNVKHIQNNAKAAQKAANAAKSHAAAIKSQTSAVKSQINAIKSQINALNRQTSAAKKAAAASRKAASVKSRRRTSTSGRTRVSSRAQGGTAVGGVPTLINDGGSRGEVIVPQGNNMVFPSMNNFEQLMNRNNSGGGDEYHINVNALDSKSFRDMVEQDDRWFVEKINKTSKRINKGGF